MGGEYKAWLYVENKVQELLGPVQYKAAHDFPPTPVLPNPVESKMGPAQGTAQLLSTLRIPPVYLSLGVCVCVCVYKCGGSGGGGKAVVRTLPR